MGFKKLGIENTKSSDMKVGTNLTGYLLGVSIHNIKNDDGAFDLAKMILKTTLGVQSIYVQGDYAHVLKKGLMTRISKVEVTKDGEKSTKLEVEQDDTDSISVFDK